MGSGISKGTSDSTGRDSPKETYWLSAQVQSFLCIAPLSKEETHHHLDVLLLTLHCHACYCLPFSLATFPPSHLLLPRTHTRSSEHPAKLRRREQGARRAPFSERDRCSVLSLTLYAETYVHAYCDIPLLYPLCRAITWTLNSTEAK